MREEPFLFLNSVIKTLNNYICPAQWDVGAEGGKLQLHFSAIPKNPADTSVSPLDFFLIFQPGCVWDQPHPAISLLLTFFLGTRSCFSSPSWLPFAKHTERSCRSLNLVFFFTSLEITKPETFSPSRRFKFTEVNNHFCSL